MKFWDTLKANLGLFILTLLLFVFLGMCFYVYIAPNSTAVDFMKWLEGKAGEVLASIMTIIVSAATGGRRAGDSNGSSVPAQSAPASPAPAPHP